MRERTRLRPEAFDALYALMRNAVVLVPISAFGPHILEANVLLSGHVKDAPYVALALALGAPFWTNEKFPRRVPTITTEELRQLLGS